MGKIYDAHAYIGADQQWVKLGLPTRLTVDTWLKMMDDAGIDGALLAPADPGVTDSFNQDIKEIAAGIKNHPGRVFGMCRVRPRSGQAAITTLRKAVEDQGFQALLLHTSDDEYSLSDRDIINPVIEEAGRLNVPIVFNATDGSWSTCTPSMVADVAVDYPEMTFVIGRMGFGGVNGWPGSPEQLLPAMKKAPNTVADTASVFHCKFIQDAVEAVGIERVLMGSNAPYFPLELSKIMFLKHMNKMTDKQKAQVTGGNMARLLKIR